jgi:cobalt-precorrin-7 (C5)-methyltransferase
MNRSKIMIVGCGPGAAEYVTPVARRAVAGAEVLVGSHRLLELFWDYAGERIPVEADIAAILEQVDRLYRAGRAVAVLVSGDPGLYSLAACVLEQFGRENCLLVPAVSSVQVAFARLGLSWADAKIISAHGRTPQVSGEELAAVDKLAILAGKPEALRWTAKTASQLRDSHAAFLCENLTLPDEHVGPVTPEQLAEGVAASLSIVLLIRRSLVS